MGVVPTPRSYSIYFVWFSYFFVYIVEKNMKKNYFAWLLIYFYFGLQNDFTLQYLNLCKMGGAENQ